MSTLIANIDDLLGGAERLETPEARAYAALIVQREMTRAVGRMWALYETHDELNSEQPSVACAAYAASLDEWWHVCIGAIEAWSEAAGVPYVPPTDPPPPFKPAPTPAEDFESAARELIYGEGDPRSMQRCIDLARRGLGLTHESIPAPTRPEAEG
jgi:hypothetical protein